MKTYIQELNNCLELSPDSPIFLTRVKRPLFVSQKRINLYGSRIALELSRRFEKNQCVYSNSRFLATTSIDLHNTLKEIINFIDNCYYKNQQFFYSLNDADKRLKSTGKLSIEGRIDIRKGNYKIFGRFRKSQPSSISQSEFEFWRDLMLIAPNPGDIYYDPGYIYFAKEENISLFLLKYGEYL